MISKEEYLEIKDFLRHRVIEINRLDNSDRKIQRENETKYSLPNQESYGWMPAIPLCFSVKLTDKQQMYVIPYAAFYNLLDFYLRKAILNYPHLFGTGNAKDVITALYKVSDYEPIGDIDAYQQFLIDKAYCYFLIRDNNGELNPKIFRLDLFRHILSNDKNGSDFDGGLMHAYRHFSWHGLKLSSGNGETALINVWELPLLLAKAILLNNDLTNNPLQFNDGERTWNIVYHIDPETGVYYLTTAHVL